MRFLFFLHFIAALSSLHSTHVTVASVRAPLASPNEHITVAAGLNLKGETCWMFWRLLLLIARLSSPPAATRGWYHYRVQPEHNSIDLMCCCFFHSMHACMSQEFPFADNVIYMFLVLPVCLLPVLHLPTFTSARCLLPPGQSRTPSFLKSLKSCR